MKPLVPPEVIKNALLSEMRRAGIVSAKEQAMLLAQVDHESGGFTILEERFNYRADRLMLISVTARKAGPMAVAVAIAKGPEAVANLMYSNRMGNDQPGDGWKYRGRGPIQLTGKGNYTAAGKALGLDLVTYPDSVFDPETGAKVAVWYWKNRVGKVGASGNVMAVTKLINGGTIGLADRAAKYAKYTKQLQGLAPGQMLA